MRWSLKGGSVRPNFSTYDDIWVDHAAIDSHIEVNVPTTAARAEGTLDLQNLGACLVLDHESGGRWRWWRQWWWRWWRSWHEIAQIATITEHNLKTFRFWAARSCLHSLSPHFSSDSHLAHVPPIAKKILIFWGVAITTLVSPYPFSHMKHLFL